MDKNYVITSEINREINDNLNDFIVKSENKYQNRIEEIADSVYEEREVKPLVLISGPSGSGKTTTAHKIGEALRKKGASVHIISMDNYFHPRNHPAIPKDREGNPNFESPYSMNIKLFQENLKSLLKCEKAEIPSFNFITQISTFENSIERKTGEIVIIEGIHALNPLVTGEFHSSSTFIYVSVRTRILSEDKSSIVHPRKIRLMRRLIRDKLYRGRDIDETFEMYKSVTLGEEEHIVPYKKFADFDIDTFFAYEPSVYAGVLLPELLSHSPSFRDVESYESMCKIFTELEKIELDKISKTALIREFTGGSELVYC